MMMRMLAEGGVPIVINHIRQADDDNTDGYFELERVKQLRDGQTDWLAQVSGKAVKVISALLECLPSKYEYKIIFMERDIREILLSQKKMLSRRNESGDTDDMLMADQFEKHLAAIKFWLARQPNMQVLYVNYNKLLYNPAPFCETVKAFLELPLDIEAMLSVPNGMLYRSRAN